MYPEAHKKALDARGISPQPYSILSIVRKIKKTVFQFEKCLVILGKYILPIYVIVFVTQES